MSFWRLEDEMEIEFGAFKNLQVYLADEALALYQSQIIYKTKNMLKTQAHNALNLSSHVDH